MPHDLLGTFGHGLVLSAGMAWQTAWTLVLGFTISAVLQSVVSTDEMRQAFGRAGPKEVAMAALAGAASSSCSYASAAIMRTLFKKGAALVTALAFMVASTNLVLELGIILLVLMGWPFMLGEWLGGVVMIAIMALVVHLTYPAGLVEEARKHPEAGGGHDHGSMTLKGDTIAARLGDPQAPVRIAQNFVMEWSMLWKDLAIGFVVGGLIMAFVPDTVWRGLFLTGAPGWLRLPFDVLIGPVVAVLTFVCSIGNVPLAAVLWAGGASFGGVLAFLYADLIVLPLLDTYRRTLGWRMAGYIGGVLFVTMAAAAFVMDLAFSALGWVPARAGDVQATITHFAFNYTFWLNLAAGVVAAVWFVINHRHPMDHGHAGHDHGAHDHAGHDHAGHDHAGHHHPAHGGAG